MRTKPFVLAALILASTLLSAAWAQPAFMVKDIGNTLSFTSPAARPVSVELDGVLYFLSDDGVQGGELWRSDGTSAGTRLLRDVCPGICSSFPTLLTPFQHKVYWIASDGSQWLLMASDGTPQGTAPFLDPASPAASLFLIPLGEAGGRLLLSGVTTDGSRGELWATDGTADGTVRLRVFQADPGALSSRPILIGRAGAALVFKIESLVTGGETLWATDGTADGTLSLKTVPLGFSFYGIVAAGGRLFFQVYSQSTSVIWMSDGTPAGTQPLAGVPFGFNPTAVGSQVFFVLPNDAGGGLGGELWKSDGTPAGTVLVKAFTNFSPFALIAAGSRLFFLVNGVLWVSDGTAAGTLPVRQFPVGVEGLAAFGDRLAFFADGDTHGGLQPWVSDGTSAGTYPVAEIFPPIPFNSSWGFVLGVLGDRWLFAAPAPQGWFLWSSDGTPGGLTRIRRLDVQTSSFSRPLADLDGTLLFSSYNQQKLQQELWRTDGSAAGTTPVILDRLGFPPFLGTLGQIGGRFFFASSAPGVPGPVPQGYFTPYSLWTTDGTFAGTRGVPYFPLGLYSPIAAKAGGSLYVWGANPKRAGLFKTDGTVAGTVFLHRFNPNIERLSQLLAVGDRLCFLVGFGSSSSLWTSDGTVAGTKPVLPGAFQEPALWPVPGPLLFFTADSATGTDLWTSDGTAAGTHPIAKVRPKPPGGGGAFAGDSVVTGYQAAAGGRIFFIGDDGTHGPELWSTDGTAAGTHMVADIFPGSAGSSISSLTTLGRRVFFAADDGAHGSELWTSDGTAAGTHRVADILPGAGSSQPASLTVVDGRLLFAADDGVHGLEPWVSDGTAAGTWMLQDVAPGPLPASPGSFLVSGGYVYFSATDAAHGFELWAVPRSALRAHP